MTKEFCSISLLPDVMKVDSVNLRETEPLGYVLCAGDGGALSFLTVQVPTDADDNGVSFHLHWFARKKQKLLGALALLPIVNRETNPTVLQAMINQPCDALRLNISNFGNIKAHANSIICPKIFITLTGNSEICLVGGDMVYSREVIKKPVARKRK